MQFSNGLTVEGARKRSQKVLPVFQTEIHCGILVRSGQSPQWHHNSLLGLLTQGNEEFQEAG